MLEKLSAFKEAVSTASGLVAGMVMAAFGAWTEGLTTLIFLMAADYVSGLVVAAVFKNSPKTKNGGLESNAGLKGIIRKVAILVIVVVAHRIDVFMGINYATNATLIGFIVNEVVSLIENVGLMGVSIPDILKNCIDKLMQQARIETVDEDEDESPEPRGQV